MGVRPVVPFIDLPIESKKFRAEAHGVLDELLSSGQFILGSNVTLFEKEFADYIGVREAVSVGNGSDALVLSLKALGIGHGDKVVVPVNSFIASAWAVIAVGASIIFCDVGEDLNIDVESLKAILETNDVRAVIAVSLTGRPYDVCAVNVLCDGFDVHLIEDSAQAIGASVDGRMVGQFGIASAFSLHPLKTLGVMGDGGIVATDCPETAASIRLLRNHGLVDRDHAIIWGVNSRLDEFHAGIARLKLGYVDSWVQKHREIAEFYSSELYGYVDLPVEERPGHKSAFHNFVIRTDSRDDLKDFLQSRGVGSAVHYPVPLHLQQCAQNLGYRYGDFPVAERLAATMLSLPIYWGLKLESMRLVTETIKAFFKDR